MAVKLLAVSDTHGISDIDRIADMAIRRKSDILVIAGDIMPADVRVDPNSYYWNVFMPVARKLLGKGIAIVATPGNHDLYLAPVVNRDYPGVSILCDREATVKGLRFYGTPWVPFINGRWAYEDTEERLASRFAQIPEGIDFLVAHTPPMGRTFEDWDVCLQKMPIYRRHLGSSALRVAIEAKRPKCVICGHIHSGDHMVGDIGETAVLNCSMVDEKYLPGYKPAEIMIDDGEMKFRTNGGTRWRTMTSKKWLATGR